MTYHSVTLLFRVDPANSTHGLGADKDGWIPYFALHKYSLTFVKFDELTLSTFVRYIETKYPNLPVEVKVIHRSIDLNSSESRSHIAIYTFPHFKIVYCSNDTSKTIMIDT